LIEADVTSPGEPDLGDRTPSRLFDVRAVDALSRQVSYFRVQVVTHEIELLRASFLGGMNG
jgi:hypothetical protein